MLTENDYFAEFLDSRTLYEQLMERINTLGPVEIKVTKSQIALFRTRPFAWIWIPEKHLHRKAAPPVLSISFPRRDPSPRWKQIIEASHGRFMHHLEFYSTDDINDQVGSWLQYAWNQTV